MPYPHIIYSEIYRQPPGHYICGMKLTSKPKLSQKWPLKKQTLMQNYQRIKDIMSLTQKRGHDSQRWMKTMHQTMPSPASSTIQFLLCALPRLFLFLRMPLSPPSPSTATITPPPIASVCLRRFFRESQAMRASARLSSQLKAIGHLMKGTDSCNSADAGSSTPSHRTPH